MARYIDIDKLAEELNTKPAINANARCAQILHAILTAPIVDAVEVVRCKDCAFWQNNNGGYPHESCVWGKDETPDADDFCSLGERRKDN